MFVPPVIVSMGWSVQTQEARKGTESRHAAQYDAVVDACRVELKMAVCRCDTEAEKRRRARRRERKNRGGKVKQDKRKTVVVKTRNQHSCTLSELSRSTSGQVGSCRVAVALPSRSRASSKQKRLLLLVSNVHGDGRGSDEGGETRGGVGGSKQSKQSKLKVSSFQDKSLSEQGIS